MCSPTFAQTHVGRQSGHTATLLAGVNFEMAAVGAAQ